MAPTTRAVGLLLLLVFASNSHAYSWSLHTRERVGAESFWFQFRIHEAPEAAALSKERVRSVFHCVMAVFFEVAFDGRVTLDEDGQATAPDLTRATNTCLRERGDLVAIEGITLTKYHQRSIEPADDNYHYIVGSVVD